MLIMLIKQPESTTSVKSAQGYHPLICTSIVFKASIVKQYVQCERLPTGAKHYSYEGSKGQGMMQNF